jgi:hypothetical protein
MSNRHELPLGRFNIRYCTVRARRGSFPQHRPEAWTPGRFSRPAKPCIEPHLPLYTDQGLAAN